MRNEFKIGDTVKIVGNPSGKDVDSILMHLGKTGKIICIAKSGMNNNIYFVDSAGLYFFEDELVFSNELREPVTEDDVLDCFSREGD